MPTTTRVRTVETTLRNKILEVEPDHDAKAAIQIEYEFSNGKVFKGRYASRGPYAED